MGDFDLAILGSGSGNSIPGPEFDEWRIAVVEESTFGGTCLNVGCIPTKMLVYPADLAAHVHSAKRLGVDLSLGGVRWRDIRDRVFGRIDPISAGGREYRISGQSNTTLFEGHAQFQDSHTLELSSGESITADRIVIATGSRPVLPAVVTASDVPFHTSDTVMRIDELPERLVIMGGGYIAAEFAHIFSAFGVQTTVIARSSPLLRHLDADVAARFTEIAKQRVDLRLGATVSSLTRDGAGVRVDLVDGSVVKADLLLLATGRQPNSDLLGLDRAGVAVHPDGRIDVDCYQRTTQAHIWALGDCCSPYQLKHVANHEAKVVAHNLAHPDELVESDHRYVPAAVFTDPQIAAVGMTEAQAAASGRPYVTAVQDYSGTAFGWAMEDTTSFCKVIADPSTGELLGAHLIGDQAATLIQPLIQAMSFGLGARRMARGQYWIHPALTEVVENALLHLDVPRLDWEPEPHLVAEKPEPSFD